MTYVQRFHELGTDDLAVAGGKGANLGELARGGFPVPPGFVLTTAAYAAFVAANGLAEPVADLAALPADAAPDAFERAAEKIRALFLDGTVPDDVARELAAAYGEFGGDVAVRSSATAEDLPGASFAGQQETFLNVHGAGAVAEAVRACWASLWTARAMAYRARQGDREGLASPSLAVVVQRMVEADAAGVLFTANPVTGRRDQVVISAAWGLGEAVVGGAVTPDDLVVDRAGRVLSRTVADKRVMTVYAEHGTREQPVPEDRRRAPVLDDADAAALARLGVRIEEHFGVPQDVEWVRADGRLSVVQARPVTALPEPAGDTPTDWSVPERGALYARASIVEQLPDPLTPLFADLVDGAVQRSLRALLAEFGAADAVREGDVGLPTVNGYAYYRYSLPGMGRIVLRTPLGVRYLLDRERGARHRWAEQVHPGYARTVAEWAARPVDGRGARELVAGVRALLDAGAAYYTTVQTIIPIAVTTEVAFTSFYDRLVRRAGDPPASTFLLGFPSAPIRAEEALYDLAAWTRERPALAAALDALPSGRLAALLDGTGPDGIDPALWDEWRTRFREHLDRHGHTVYNLDFAVPVPADDPAPLLDALRFFLREQGADPRERRRRTAARREAETAAVRARLDPVRRAVFIRLLRRAQDAAPMREDALADVGLAWPLLRRMLRELGRRLVAVGAVDGVDDVFWLRGAEVDAAADALDAGTAPAPSAAAVEERKVRWRGQRRATPPQLLPERTWRFLQRWMPAVGGQQEGPVLRGVGASAGVVTAPARVLAGPAEFGAMRPGEVLVAAITTPAWTSLFARAAAVVTDVGGPLSHSSIVAREYGIPAVLGTGVASRRIRSGQRLRVDGDAGTVTLVDETVDPAGDEPGTTAPGRRNGVRAALGAAAVVGLVAWARRRRT